MVHGAVQPLGLNRVGVAEQGPRIRRVTLKQYELPVKIVLFDNATLAMVRLEMLVEGLPSFATDSRRLTTRLWPARLASTP